jgi:hypothetical protein
LPTLEASWGTLDWQSQEWGLSPTSPTGGQQEVDNSASDANIAPTDVSEVIERDWVAHATGNRLYASWSSVQATWGTSL